MIGEIQCGMAETLQAGQSAGAGPVPRVDEVADAQLLRHQVRQLLQVDGERVEEEALRPDQARHLLLPPRHHQRVAVAHWRDTH